MQETPSDLLQQLSIERKKEIFRYCFTRKTKIIDSTDCRTGERQFKFYRLSL